MAEIRRCLFELTMEPSLAPLLTSASLASLGLQDEEVGIVIVDHGSRRSESNDLLLKVAEAFQAATGLSIVEPAHMELAEPSIRTAFDRAVARGARMVVVHPYFLSPGRHWRHDIPELVADAASRHAGVRHLVTAPLGLHPLMLQIMQDRIRYCLQRATKGGEPCDVCRMETGCVLNADVERDSDGE